MSRMNLLSTIRTRAGIGGLTVALGLLSLASGVPTTFAASISQSGPIMQTTVDGTTIGGVQSPSLIMKDGNICDPIRHMGC